MIRKIEVERALSMLSTLDSRIEDLTNRLQYCAACKKNDVNYTPGSTKLEYAESVKANWQRLNALINLRANIKGAIAVSNVTSMVTVCGKEISRASAIEMKSSIIIKERLLMRMRGVYDAQTIKVDQRNSVMEQRISDTINQRVSGTDKKLTAEDFQSVSDFFRRDLEYELVDPLNILEKIEELENEINRFKSEVDVAIKISNCSSFIEIEDNGTGFFD